MVNSRKSTVVISGIEGDFDEQGDGKDCRSRTAQRVLEANDEDCSGGMILLPTIVSYSTLMVRPRHSFRYNDPMSQSDKNFITHTNLLLMILWGTIYRLKC